MISACGGVENCLVVVGSENAPFSMRNFFSLEERTHFLKLLFPKLQNFSVPDVHDDKRWIGIIDRRLWERNIDPSSVTFFGGCAEDIRFFVNAGRQTVIMNRFDGTTPKVSATEVRDALVAGRSLDGLVNPAIAEAVRSVFRRKMEALTKNPNAFLE